MKEKIFFFKGEKYDIEAINKEGGFRIIYFLLITMIKNLCGPHIFKVKRSFDSDVHVKITEYNVDNEWTALHDEIIKRNPTKKENNKISLFTS